MMAPTPQRWYEKNPIVADAMSSWQLFPARLQRVLAAHIDKLVKRYHLTARYSGIYRLSPGRINVAIKSTQRRRWFDKDQQVRRTINTLRWVDHDDLLRMAFAIIRMRHYFNTIQISPDQFSTTELEKVVDDIFQNPNFT